MRQRFFKLNSRWYADVPNHTLEENEMVCGSDTLLEEPCDFPFAILTRIEHDSCGATYKVESSLDTDLVWICNVTHDVLGEHPDKIYINSIS